MSLGLNDLTKKKKSASPKTSPAGASASSSTKSKTTRPWSGDSLKRSTAVGSSAPKKAPPNPQAVMNEEWSSGHAAPFFWVDVNESPLLAKVHDRLSALEERVETSVLTPLRFLKKFIGR